MGCRFRAVVWSLTSLSILSILASIHWFSPSPIPSPSASSLSSSSSSLSLSSSPSLLFIPYSHRSSSPFRPYSSIGSRDPHNANSPGGDVTNHELMESRRKALKISCSEPLTRGEGGGGEGRRGEEGRKSIINEKEQKREEEKREGEGGEDGFDSISTRPSSLSHFIVDDKNKVLYCYVPKVACTNWKRVMLIMSGRSNQTEPLAIPSDAVHRKQVFTKLTELEPAAIKHRLQTYTKFLFVRHPVERVVSAFRNKFEKNYTSSAYFQKRFGLHILKKYRKGDVPKSGYGVTFPEFVSFLIDTEPKDYNEHWAPVSSMCHPCQARFDFIGKYETLASDAQFILGQIGAPPFLRFPPVISSKTTSQVEAYFNSLSPQQQQRLVDIYRDDFRAFDYHYKDFI